jgi:hypothetical protein
MCLVLLCLKICGYKTSKSGKPWVEGRRCIAYLVVQKSNVAKFVCRNKTRRPKVVNEKPYRQAELGVQEVLRSAQNTNEENVVMMTNTKQGMHVKGEVRGLMYVEGGIVAQRLVAVMLCEEHAKGVCRGTMME